MPSNGDPGHRQTPKNANHVTLFMAAKSLENLLNINDDGDLGDIVRRARELGELTETLSKSLPADLAPGLLAVNIRGGNELVAVCPSSAWASRLRFEEQALIDAARAAGANVDSVSVRIARVDYNKRG